MTCEGCSNQIDKVLGKLKGNIQYLFIYFYLFSKININRQWCRRSQH